MDCFSRQSQDYFSVTLSIFWGDIFGLWIWTKFYWRWIWLFKFFFTCKPVGPIYQLRGKSVHWLDWLIKIKNAAFSWWTSLYCIDIVKLIWPISLPCQGPETYELKQWDSIKNILDWLCRPVLLSLPSA